MTGVDAEDILERTKRSTISLARLWKDLLAKLDGRQSMGDHPDS